MFAREILVVFVKPNSPISRSGNLVVFEIEKLVGRNIVGENVRTFGIENCGEHNAVENNIVLADKVNEFGIGRFPIFFPIFGKLLSKRDIADRRIKPNV